MANQIPSNQFEITNGPSKFDLMTSVFDAKKVKITCNIGSSPKLQPILEVYFPLIGVEGGNYDVWRGTVCFIDRNYEICKRSFRYNSKTRQGIVYDIKGSWEYIIARSNVMNITKKF